MIVGEPSLMGGEMEEEDERFISRLENNPSETTNNLSTSHPIKREQVSPALPSMFTNNNNSNPSTPKAQQNILTSWLWTLNWEIYRCTLCFVSSSNAFQLDQQEQWIVSDLSRQWRTILIFSITMRTPIRLNNNQQEPRANPVDPCEAPTSRFMPVVSKISFSNRNSYVRSWIVDSNIRPKVCFARRIVARWPFSLACSVQHESIPQAILGTDIVCQAKSGMGKTAVFVLATLQQLEPVDDQVNRFDNRSIQTFGFRFRRSSSVTREN